MDLTETQRTRRRKEDRAGPRVLRAFVRTSSSQAADGSHGDTEHTEAKERIPSPPVGAGPASAVAQCVFRWGAEPVIGGWHTPVASRVYGAVVASGFSSASGVCGSASVADCTAGTRTYPMSRITSRISLQVGNIRPLDRL